MPGLSKVSELAVSTARKIISEFKKFLVQDDRPICPSCLEPVNIEDEVFMHRGLSYHGKCIGYKRPKPSVNDDQRIKRQQK